LKFSVVVIARNEGAELGRTVKNLRATLPPRSELVVVDDGSRGRVTLPPRSGRVFHVRGLGVARARNFGAARTSGDVLVFADAHIRVDEGWWRPLLETLENPKAGAASPAITHLPAAEHIGYGLSFKGPDLSVAWLPRKSDRPFSVPIIPGCCLAMRRETFDAIGGWDAGLMHRGGVDNELSVRMWTLGYDLYIVPGVLCRHLFRTQSPYHVGWPEYLHNRQRLAMAHFSAPRMARVVAALANHPHFGAAMELVLANGTGERRREMLARRTRTDNQFFRRFAIPW
jgi:glycosyltransferase involved in cell wall biosynthesis